MAKTKKPATITEHEMQEVDRANATRLAPVVFVHGLWLLPSSWDRWAKMFEKAGFTALTPGWPDDPETVEEANAKPEVFANKTIAEVADHFDKVIRGLTKKPAIIGHSFGGLMAQILAGRGLAAVSVAIDPAPFQGVLPLPFSALKSAFPVLGNPANRKRAVPLTYEQFRYGFANAVSEDEAKDLYAKFAVPAAGAPLFQAATANFNPWTEAKVDSTNPERGPLLLISGEKDHTVPWAIANASYKCRRHRDRRDEEPRPRARRRQRLARGGGDGAHLRPAVRLGARRPDGAIATERPLRRRAARSRQVLPVVAAAGADPLVPVKQTCTTLNCFAIGLPGIVNGHPTPPPTAAQWVGQFAGQAASCMRFQVVAASRDLAMSVVAPDGTVFTNDNGGIAPCPTCPKVVVAAGKNGYYTVVISHAAGTAGVETNFTLRAGVYNTGNVPNCSAPTTGK